MSYYGYRWQNTRPPGLPASARPVAADYDGRDFLRALFSVITRAGFPGLARALVILAQNESSATRARPANNFDNRPPEQRPIDPATGKTRGRISAWGLWQYNESAWKRLGRPGWSWQRVAGFVPGDVLPEAATQMPWEATRDQEMIAPIVLMTQAYMGARRAARERGADVREQDRVGEAAVYWQHSRPSDIAGWLTAGAPVASIPTEVQEKMNREVPTWSR